MHRSSKPAVEVQDRYSPGVAWGGEGYWGIVSVCSNHVRGCTRRYVVWRGPVREETVHRGWGFVRQCMGPQGHLLGFVSSILILGLRSPMFARRT